MSCFLVQFFATSLSTQTLRRAGPGILGSDSCILFVPTDEALKQYCASNPPLSVAIMNPAIFARAIKGHMIGEPCVSGLAEGA